MYVCEYKLCVISNRINVSVQRVLNTEELQVFSETISNENRECKNHILLAFLERQAM